MRNLQTEISLIKPKLLEGEEKIKAWFTLKNKGYGDESSIIRGLNLGFNTPENRDLIAQNRLNLLSSIQVDPEWIAYADQVHSNRIQLVSEGGTYPSTDGLITRIPGLTLGIQVADCAAVLLWDSVNKVIAALHAGWRGAAGNIVSKGIDRMIEQGSNPKKINAFVSPCISQKNFEVGQEVVEQFSDEFVDYENYEKPHIDLKRFIRQQMLQKEIPESQIEIRDECTVDDVDDFYSYRREGNKSGRMLALIQIAE